MRNWSRPDYLNLSLFPIYYHHEFNERVSIKRVRKLRMKIKNELIAGMYEKHPDSNFKKQQLREFLHELSRILMYRNR